MREPTFPDALQPVPILDVRLANPGSLANRGFADIDPDKAYAAIALVARDAGGHLVFVETVVRRLGLGPALFADEYTPGG